MDPISRRSFLSATVALAASPTLAVMETPHVPRRIQRPFAETPYWLQATGTPGLTVALLEGGKPREVLCFGSRDREGKAPVSEASVFQAVSVPKQALLYA